MIFRVLTVFLFTASLLAAPTAAQTREVPYWATIKTDRAFMRVGPSKEYHVEWVFKRSGLPIKVVRVTGPWRLVRDSDGTQGWVASSQLSPSRSALVVGEGNTEIREAPADNAKLKWHVEPGVVGTLGDCQASWCEIDIRGHFGWIKQSRLWGTGAP